MGNESMEAIVEGDGGFDAAVNYGFDQFPEDFKETNVAGTPIGFWEQGEV